MDVAESSGLNLPFDCRLGSCVACAAKVESGSVDNRNNIFLSDELLDMGYTLSCIAYATSDCTITTHVADEVNALF